MVRGRDVYVGSRTLEMKGIKERKRDQKRVKEKAKVRDQ
jgi:hypothetical protein